MKTISEIRLENLQTLIDETGTLEALANAAGTSSVYLSQVRNGTLDQKTGKPRQMGNAIARRLEVATSKPVGWLDALHRSTTVKTEWLSDTLSEASNAYFSNYDEQISRGESGEERPFVGMAGEMRLDRDGNIVPTPRLPDDATICVALHAPDIAAAAYRIKGQEAFPALRDGWYIVMEPLQSVQEGSYARFNFLSGKTQLAEFLYRRGSSIETAHLVTGARVTLDVSELNANEPMTAVTALLPPCKGFPMT